MRSAAEQRQGPPQRAVASDHQGSRGKSAPFPFVRWTLTLPPRYLRAKTSLANFLVRDLQKEKDQAKLIALKKRNSGIKAADAAGVEIKKGQEKNYRKRDDMPNAGREVKYVAPQSRASFHRITHVCLHADKLCHQRSSKVGQRTVMVLL